MTLHTDDFASVALADHMAEFGESFTWKPKAGPERVVTGFVEDERVDTNRGTYDKKQREMLEITFENNTTTGITDPKPGDRLERALETTPRITWQFDSVLHRDAASLILVFTRPRKFKSGQSPNSQL